jgi:hypothetical protein
MPAGEYVMGLGLGVVISVMKVDQDYALFERTMLTRPAVAVREVVALFAVKKCSALGDWCCLPCSSLLFGPRRKS